ncbi:MAG: hypothetical protein KTR14_07435 [Vampirovibrio sp.]|nr:hypothetical protein [Vampirovibrio sp.]
MLFREISGNAIPRLAVSRNRNELFDTSVHQLAVLAAFYGTGLLLNPIIQKATSTFQKQLGTHGKQWFRFGSSFSVFALTASLASSVPFFRNYVTISKTGTVDFAQMIGVKKQSEVDEITIKQKADQNLNHVLTAGSIGAAFSLAFLLGGLFLARKEATVPKVVQWLNRTLSLKSNKLTSFNPWSNFLFTAVPIWTGMVGASRDQYELKEALLRCTVSCLGFFIFPHTVAKAIEKFSAKKFKHLSQAKNVAYVGKFITSVAVLSLAPSLLNIYFTRQRVKGDAAKAKTQPNVPALGYTHFIHRALPLYQPPATTSFQQLSLSSTGLFPEG